MDRSAVVSRALLSKAPVSQAPLSKAPLSKASVALAPLLLAALLPLLAGGSALEAAHEPGAGSETATPAGAAAPAAADWSVDLQMVQRIRDEGFRRSQVMELAEHLTEVIGPRLTGSPALEEANAWTRDTLASWGLEAELEPFDFGRGWEYTDASLRLVEPREVPLSALPEAWTPGTGRPRKGHLVRMDLGSKEDLEALEERAEELDGAVLLVDDPRELDRLDEPLVDRLDEAELAALQVYEIPENEGGESWRDRAADRWLLQREIRSRLAEIGVVATLSPSSRHGGTLRVGNGGSYLAGDPEGVPGLVVATEQYNHLIRLVELAEEKAAEASDGEGGGAERVIVEVDVEARFLDGGRTAYNTLAVLPGTDLAHQTVVVGAHLDSWHTGTGATDNASGCAVAMEAVRILTALGVRPRRSIAVALWGGEEQGLLGSQAHVANRYAMPPEPSAGEADPGERTREELEALAQLPLFYRGSRYPLTLREGWKDFSVYFNLDNGGGRIRGIHTEENLAAARIFEGWLAPFADLGATTVSPNRTGATDHVAFDRAGLPGFQFIQDDLDYFSRTHHTNMDTYDHLSRDDLAQSSVILATFLYHAAMADELIPRKPLRADQVAAKEGSEPTAASPDGGE